MNDLINRQEAIDILQLGAEILRRVLDDMDIVGIDREKYSYGLKLLESDIEDIKELPPAQPERKTGQWILYDKRFPWMQDYKCSECGNYLDFSGVNAGRGSANFCPNCGADMRGEENEID